MKGSALKGSEQVFSVIACCIIQAADSVNFCIKRLK